MAQTAKTTMVTARLPDALHRKLKQEADTRRVSKTALISKALEKFFSAVPPKKTSGLFE